MIKTVALYGKIGIEIRYCPDCKREAFVINNIIQCCDKRVELSGMDWIKFKRESPSSFGKHGRKISNKLKNKILIDQDWKCAYCGIDLHTVIAHFDHFVPFSYIPDSRVGNMVAACSDCNLLKSSKIFSNVGEVSYYVKEKSLKRKALRQLRPTFLSEA